VPTVVRARVLRTGETLGDRIERAESLRARTVGLLGRRSLPRGSGLWLEPCSSVHTFFMSFEIDVVFLDVDGRVLRVFVRLAPWRIAVGGWSARSAVELPAGAAGAIAAGDRLEITPV
jgi:uncharacterized membrane protein (UPF0127 family)